ncbi:hypothetical protein BTS2_0743 [Bacillus sp. TS-2]|nr:hypothetical protein BTS2_0743 [Bacillus sp. TS-2]
MESLISGLENKKKNLLFTSKQEQQQFLKSFRDEQDYEDIRNEIISEAERLIKEPNPELTFSLFDLFYTNGSRTEYERTYFLKRKRLNAFAIMLLLNPDNATYKDALQNVIWSICLEYTWCLPAHTKKEEGIENTYTIDLFAAETAFSLCEIKELLKEVLEPFILQYVSHEVAKRVLQPFLKQKPFFWESADHNWAAVCGGAVGAAALYEIEDPVQLTQILERVLPALEHYKKGFNDDGACLEGYVYWEYGFGYFVYFADLLLKKTNQKINLFADNKIHQIALFQQKAFLSEKFLVNFSDSSQCKGVFLGLSHYLHEKFPDIDVPKSSLRASFDEDHCSRWAPAIRNIIWYQPEKKGENWRNQSYYLETSQWFISRFELKNEKYAFATKGGHNNEPHNHNDLGHFILHGAGQTFLTDLGSGLYTKDYFGKKRYSYMVNHSFGHSVPIFNGEGQKEGYNYQAKLNEVDIQAEQDSLKINMTNAYPDGILKDYIRTYSLQKRKGVLILNDQFTISSKYLDKKLVERFITPIKNISRVEKGLLLKSEHSVDLLITFDYSLLSPHWTPLEFMNHQGVKETAYAIDLVSNITKQEMHRKIEFHFIN